MKMKSLNTAGQILTLQICMKLVQFYIESGFTTNKKPQLSGFFISFSH